MAKERRDWCVCVCVCLCAHSEPLAIARPGSEKGQGQGATSNWLLREGLQLRTRQRLLPLFLFFCRCHVLFLATVTANRTRPHKGTDCEANSGLDVHVYELQLLLQELVAPHEHILKY